MVHLTVINVKKDREQVGVPTIYTLNDKGLTTVIDWKNRDSYGKSIAPRNRAQISRLRKWQRMSRIRNASEKNLAIDLSTLD